MKKALLTRFLTIIPESAAAEAISNLKQKAQETVDEFKDRIFIAIERKNHSLTEVEKRTPEQLAQNRRDAFTYMMAGFRKDVSDKVVYIAAPPKTLDLLVAAARQVELKDKAEKGEVRLEELSQQKKANPAEDKVAKLEKQVEELKLKLKSNPAANIRCWGCDQMGHFRDKCPNGRSRGQGGQGRGSYRGRGRGGGRGSYNGGQFYNGPPRDYGYSEGGRGSWQPRGRGGWQPPGGGARQEDRVYAVEWGPGEQQQGHYHDQGQGPQEQNWGRQEEYRWSGN